MPRLRRSRLFVPTLVLLSSAAIGVQADDGIPAVLPAAIEALPLSESGVRLVQRLEEDVEEPDGPRELGDATRLTRLDHEQSPSIGATPIPSTRDSSAPFNLIQAALLTFSAGGATGGVWFAISRLRGGRLKSARPVEQPPIESPESDLLARVISGSVQLTDEAPESFELSRLFGTATASIRYLMEPTPSETAAPLVPADVVSGGAFHRLSEAVAAIEPPHFQSRASVVSVPERQVTQGGVTP